jgi:hydroxymethylpyrimidine/phosphomethylpyrimidine kinase
VNRVDALPPEALTAQIEAVVSDLAVGALKTGMLLNQALIEATAAAIAPLAVAKLIDPVMVSRAGALLLEDDAIDAYRRALLPQAELLMPNLHEARLLSGCAIEGAADVERAAERLLVMGPKAVLIKGGLAGAAWARLSAHRGRRGPMARPCGDRHPPHPRQRLHPGGGHHRWPGAGTGA